MAMLKTEREYKRTKEMVEKEMEAIDQQKQQLRDQGFSEVEIENLLSPGMVLHKQKLRQVELYERIQKGDFRGIEHDLGKMLIAFRIFRAISQAELARRLNVSPSQVSTDERHEYYNISVPKLQKVMRALGVKASFGLADNFRAADQGDSPTFEVDKDLVAN